MKRIFFLVMVLGLIAGDAAGQVTLEICQEKAKMNYPLVKQYGIIETIAENNLSNANKGWLPQLTITGRVTHQSDVTELPIKIPMITIEGMSKDQFQGVAELTQTIWDGGIMSSQKGITEANREVEKSKLNVDLYALKERVNQFYFGILLLDEQLKTNEILIDELKTNYEKISAMVGNGVANEADLNAVRVEEIKAEQRKIEIMTTAKSYREMLSLLIGEDIKEGTVFEKPGIELSAGAMRNRRPELDLFDSQKMLFESQRGTINAGIMPRIGLFVQGGYGKPGLNMLKNEVSGFYMGGVRLSWNLSGLYTRGNSLETIELNNKAVDAQRETFLFNSEIKSVQQFNEINKIRKLIGKDAEIIQLRNSIKKAAESKVENGTLSVTDLMREINSENMARQEMALHEIQLMMAIYNLKNLYNN
ncbi:MAG: TolC family protein [Ignavibacteriaceae bacterium]